MAGPLIAWSIRVSALVDRPDTVTPGDGDHRPMTRASALIEFRRKRGCERRRQVVVIAVDDHPADNRRTGRAGRGRTDVRGQVDRCHVRSPGGRALDEPVPGEGDRARRRARADVRAMAGQAVGDVSARMGRVDHDRRLPMDEGDLPSECRRLRRDRPIGGSQREDPVTHGDDRQVGAGVRELRDDRRIPGRALGVFAFERVAPDGHVDERAGYLREHEQAPVLLLRDAIERGEPLRTVRVADEGDGERPGSITIIRNAVARSPPRTRGSRPTRDAPCRRVRSRVTARYRQAAHDFEQPGLVGPASTSRSRWARPTTNRQGMRSPPAMRRLACPLRRPAGRESRASGRISARRRLVDAARRRLVIRAGQDDDRVAGRVLGSGRYARVLARHDGRRRRG